jgi:hypothetical protein
MFGSAREKPLGVGGWLFLGLFLPMGGASAGTVYTSCGCTPNTTEGCPYEYCVCEDTQKLDGLATNEYRRNCDKTQYSVNPLDWCSMSVPKSLVRNIPGNVSCTDADTSPPGSDYWFDDCTNWNFQSRHVTVLTYCTNSAN